MRGLLRGHARRERLGGQSVGRHRRDGLRRRRPSHGQARHRRRRHLRRCGRPNALHLDSGGSSPRLLHLSGHHLQLQRLPFEQSLLHPGARGIGI